ncbi:MAG: hypothetical protein LC800_16660 [Acidobacteria bacterium]|nr:hypothetical protein [Acidobacteriota bacterium]
MSERTRREDDRTVERDRADERGDAAEPDAPTAAEENEGMSTILNGGQGDGVQDNLGEG